MRASNVAQVAHEANVAIGNPKTMINLINGTPYDWVLKNMHEYQMYCKSGTEDRTPAAHDRDIETIAN